ncbi:MAG: poly-gamma-glutamate biosynthesis protein PgsC [Firmicutes bacterium]|nr:poly-gamma-glutamate biosynthesis protein PgsC [Bacillota bacterium]
METALIVGLLIAIFCHEVFGLSPGGLVVSGYLGYFLLEPQRIIITLFFATITMMLVQLLEGKMLLYGRRKFLLAILIGAVLPRLAAAILGPTYFGLGSSIGVIIPGLLARDMDTQGVWPTLAVLVPAIILVRLILELFIGMGFM